MFNAQAGANLKKTKNMEEIEFMSEDDKQERIQALYAQKKQLLDQYGVFGGGVLVNMMHKVINDQLKALGIKE